MSNSPVSASSSIWTRRTQYVNTTLVSPAHRPLTTTASSEKSTFLASTGAKVASDRKQQPVELDSDGKLIVSQAFGPDILVNSWTVWFMHRGPGVKISNYLLATKQVDSFSTVQEFWKVYSHLKRVDRLPFTSEFQIFRKGVKPMWEDPVNVNGGKWVFRFRRPFKSPPAAVSVANSPMGEFGLKSDDDHIDSELAKAALINGKSVSTHARSQARLYWEKLLLSIIGGSLASTADTDVNEIIGMVMSVRRDEDILNVWTRSRGINGDGNTRLRDAIKNLLELPESVVFEFKVHTESIKEGEQKQALYNSSSSVNSSTPTKSNNNSNNNHHQHSSSHQTGHHNHYNGNHNHSSTNHNGHNQSQHHSSFNSNSGTNNNANNHSNHHSNNNNNNSNNNNGNNDEAGFGSSSNAGSFNGGVFGTRRSHFDSNKTPSNIW